MKYVEYNQWEGEGFLNRGRRGFKQLLELWREDALLEDEFLGRTRPAS
jgi:hypothetical protein